MTSSTSRKGFSLQQQWQYKTRRVLRPNTSTSIVLKKRFNERLVSKETVVLCFQRQAFVRANDERTRALIQGQRSKRKRHKQKGSSWNLSEHKRIPHIKAQSNYLSDILPATFCPDGIRIFCWYRLPTESYHSAFKHFCHYLMTQLLLPSVAGDFVDGLQVRSLYFNQNRARVKQL